MHPRTGELLIPCPFPDRSSPHGEDAAAYVREVAAEVGIRGRAETMVLHGMALGEAAALTYPDADIGRLRVAALWIAFLVLFDDAWSDLRSLEGDWLPPVLDQHRAVERVLKGRPATATDDPLVRLLARLLSDITDLAPGWEDTRLRQEIGRYLAGTLWELDLRSRGRVADLTTYLRMRRYFSTMTVQLELDYFVCRLSLPERVRTHPCVRLVDAAVADYACIANDLYSYEAERENGLAQNVIPVLRHEFGWDEDRAWSHALRLCARALRTFTDVRDRLSRYGIEPDERTRRYFEHYEAFMSAAVRWPARSERYRSDATGFVHP
ncbi:terpene synthase family protein [Actinomadura roseirufa]|uniref:terpene synthase family protein n=1 Tax=Actinomadura roseirufa TaxID=2094049 RepID=UPI0010413988|nr:hypothetical protein [Actinomadura roseirufa]